MHSLASCSQDPDHLQAVCVNSSSTHPQLGACPPSPAKKLTWARSRIDGPWTVKITQQSFKC